MGTTPLSWARERLVRITSRVQAIMPREHTMEHTHCGVSARCRCCCCCLFVCGHKNPLATHMCHGTELSSTHRTTLSLSLSLAREHTHTRTAAHARCVARGWLASIQSPRVDGPTHKIALAHEERGQPSDDAHPLRTLDCVLCLLQDEVQLHHRIAAEPSRFNEALDNTP